LAPVFVLQYVGVTHIREDYFLAEREAREKRPLPAEQKEQPASLSSDRL
jgi:hypothetical protein